MSQNLLFSRVVNFIQNVFEGFESHYKKKSKQYNVSFEKEFVAFFFTDLYARRRFSNFFQSFTKATGKKRAALYEGISNNDISKEFLAILHKKYRNREIESIREAFFSNEAGSNSQQLRINLLAFAAELGGQVSNYQLPKNKVVKSKDAVRLEKLLRKVFGHQKFETQIRDKVFKNVKIADGTTQIAITIPPELKKSIELQLGEMLDGKPENYIVSFDPKNLNIDVLAYDTTSNKAEFSTITGDEKEENLGPVLPETMQVHLPNGLVMNIKIKNQNSFRPAKSIAKKPEEKPATAKLAEFFGAKSAEQEEITEDSSRPGLDFPEVQTPRSVSRKTPKPNVVSYLNRPQASPKSSTDQGPLELADEFSQIKSRFKMGPKPRKNLSRKPEKKGQNKKYQGLENQDPRANTQNQQGIDIFPINRPKKKKGSFRKIIGASATVAGFPVAIGSTSYGIGFLSDNDSGSFIASSVGAAGDLFFNIINFFIV